ncbi:MAG: right-handed parallel beta-helix repeat-containing protein, partial [Thermoguttaceae bacterium]|nr:right-handed parallel beta-helix repeat-containing protein [Thermoguttaceae bacterium]
LISDSPHHGMRTDGNDFYIARNEVHSVVYEFSDQSGIDIYCDPTYRGIVIEDNLWRHIGSAFALCGQAGIRLDDSISGVVMKNNFFYRSSGGFFGGIQIHGGKDNLCIGNFFADCKQAFSFSVWSPDRYQKFVKEQFPENVENQLYLDTYPFFKQIFDHPNRNYIIDNTAINCEAFNVNGNQIELFVANRCYRVPEPDANTFLTDSGALRAWLEKMSGRSLKHIGLLDNWTGVDTSVSPEFTGIR